VSPKRAKTLRITFSVVLTVVLVSAIWWRQDAIRAALEQMRKVSVPTLGFIMLWWIGEHVTRWNVYRWSLPGLKMRHAIVFNETNQAVSYAVPAGASLGTAFRFVMGRQLGFRAEALVLSTVAVAEAFSITLWSLALIWLMPEFFGGTADRNDVLLLLVCIIALAASVGIFYVLTRDTPYGRGLVLSMVLGQRKIARLRNGKLKSARGVSLPTFYRTLRTDTQELIQTRAVQLLAGGATVHICNGAMLWFSFRAVGVGDELGLAEFCRIFAISRVASNYAPTPGGVGVVEAGFTAAFVAGGVDPTQALAGVLLWRAYTYVLPLITGGVSYLVWTSSRKIHVHDHASDHL